MFKQLKQLIKYLRHSLKAILILCVLMAQIAQAGIQSDLGSFFDNSTFTNFTGAQAVQTQEGGYYSGGSGYIRTPNKNMQFANIQLPSISAGCGNIDMFTGGFSFVSGSQLVDFGKKVMQSAPTFAVQLALQTWAPSVASELKTIQQWVQAINNFNMSSCQAAQLAVGGIAGAFANSSAKQFLCQSYASQNNKFSDWLSSKQHCGNDSTADSMNQAAKSDPAIKDLIKENRNIVWYVLQKNAFLQSDPEVAELLMSITGTIVYGKSLTDKHTYVSLLTDSSDGLVKSLLYGGKLNIYQCTDGYDQEKCLKIAKDGDAGYTAITITKEKSLVYRLEQILRSMGDQFVSGNATTAIQDNITESTPFPVLKFITVDLEAGQAPPYREYADIEARQILTAYLTKLESVVKQSLAAQANSGDDDDFKTILSNIKRAETIVASITTDAYDRINNKLQLITSTMKIEQMVVGDMSSQSQQNYGFQQ